MEQRIIKTTENYSELDAFFKESKIKSLLLVCDSAFGFLNISKYFDDFENRLGIKLTKFDDFKPNPLYESVVEGVEILHKNECDMVLAIGGGSAMDVAKCIKLYSNMDPKENYLKQEIVVNDLPFIAMPTTAGTGSEATRYAVIYYNGEKQSVTSESFIPSTVIFDASALKTLPIYQKKSTMLDALCHSIESFWSVNSTEESREYSKTAIKAILSNMDKYFANEGDGNENMLKASNTAGKAINITQTTAGHAMCYKLTSLYGIAHGHAAALCVRKLWPYMVKNTDKCIDPRGEEHLKNIFKEIADAFGEKDELSACDKFAKLVDSLELEVPVAKSEEDFDTLKSSVNPVRLKNNPVGLDSETLDMLYRQIVKMQ
ncbi:MAG: phosphonoacetaldehyde reductase [Lachnospiraceae bacterium]|nr:phosphonoacetaldehyde reductase [Lachnospiraceae bacterium]